MTGTDATGSWQERALCRGDGDPDTWFAPPGTPEHDRALAVCSGCPVQAACADVAIEANVRDGIWAGVDLTYRHHRWGPQNALDREIVAKRQRDRSRDAADVQRRSVGPAA